MAIFNSNLLVYQRVSTSIPHVLMLKAQLNPLDTTGLIMELSSCQPRA